MKEIRTKSDFNEMLSQDKAILSFYHDWSNYSAIHGIENLRETESFFQKQKNYPEINFWIANVSNDNSSANFLFNWVKDKSNLLSWIRTGNPSVIWLSFGKVLNYEFSAYVLKAKGIIEEIKKTFTL